tara:strand:- start:6712 stop:6900 length:189 start_codon:yes stop_codon:yes gene_type:complete
MYAPKRNRLKREAEQDYEDQVKAGLEPERNSYLDLWAEKLGRSLRKIGKKKPKKKPAKKKEK